MWGSAALDLYIWDSSVLPLALSPLFPTNAGRREIHDWTALEWGLRSVKTFQPPSISTPVATDQAVSSYGYWEEHSQCAPLVIKIARVADWDCSRGKEWPGEYTFLDQSFPLLECPRSASQMYLLGQSPSGWPKAIWTSSFWTFLSVSVLETLFVCKIWRKFKQLMIWSIVKL